MNVARPLLHLTLVVSALSPSVACTQSLEGGGAASPAPKVALSSASIAVAESANDVGFDIWRQVRGDAKSNLTISPASISAAFAMTYLGARGETAEEMRKVFHWSGDADSVATGYAGLTGSFRSHGKEVQLDVANRLFGQVTSTFSTPFLNQTRAAFGAELARLDFHADAEKARTFINDWISDSTHEKIKDLLPEGSVSSARLVLVNAVYFKGSWASPFAPEITDAAPFTTAAGAKIAVPMMHQTSDFKYSKTDGVSLVELPYKGGNLAMDILLPDDPNGLSALESKLTSAQLEQMVPKGESEVALSLPRFKITPPAVDLTKPLAALGLKRAFDPREADFSGMDAHRDLFVGAAFHKAFVEVNEQGTEAAAATALAANPSVPPQMTVDHPFLFVLRDLTSKSILFLGRVADPTKG